MSELALGAYQWRVRGVNAYGEGDWSPTWTFVISDSRATLPFYDGFESGILGTGWYTSTTGAGRVRVSSQYPYTETYSLLLDSGSGYALAAAELMIDLAGHGNVELSFWWREFGDENHAEDGVFISDDYGSTWYRALSFNNGPSSFQESVVDIDAAAAAHGLVLNDHFLIKFQFYDDYSVPTDGYAVDEVSVQVRCLPEIGIDPSSLGVTIFQDKIVSRTLTISNTGNCALDFGIYEQYGALWLSESPTSGRVALGESQDVTVTFDATGLLPGSYSESLVIQSNDPDENEVTVPVSMQVMGNHPPNEPGNPEPADGAMGQDIDVNLNWAGGDPDPGDTVTYDVYFGANNSAPDDLLCDDVATLTCDPGPLDHGTTYYWYVVATDGVGASTSGDTWDFTTMFAIYVPIILRDH
jgi:hypothetical protein